MTDSIVFQRYVAMTGLLHSNYTGQSSLSDIGHWFNMQNFWDLAALPSSVVTILTDNILHLKLILKMGNAKILFMFSTH